jgi:heat shock protein HslJ
MLKKIVPHAAAAIVALSAGACAPVGQPSAADPAAGSGPMQGEFSYMADAGRFMDCRTGESLPVAMVEDNAALERAYLAATEQPGAPMLVTFEGRIAMAPAMEGDGQERAVIVEDFGEARAGRLCSDAVDPAPLTGTYWRLTDLPGDPAFAVDPDLRAHLVFDDANRVSGASGCNRLTGGFTLDGDALTFGPLAGTRMACPAPAMELEQRFHAALMQVTAYSIEGEILTLAGADGVLARFERYLE